MTGGRFDSRFLRWEKSIMLQKWRRLRYDRRNAHRKFPQWQEIPFFPSPSNHSKGHLSGRPSGHDISSGAIIRELSKGARQLQWSKPKQSWVPRPNRIIEPRRPGSRQKAANQKIRCYLLYIYLSYWKKKNQDRLPNIFLDYTSLNYKKKTAHPKWNARKVRRRAPFCGLAREMELFERDRRNGEAVEFWQKLDRRSWCWCWGFWRYCRQANYTACKSPGIYMYNRQNAPHRSVHRPAI